MVQGVSVQPVCKLKKICLSGYKGSGKDYLGNILVESYGFQKRSFSDELKLMAAFIYPWMKKDYPAMDKEKSVRELHNDMTLPDVTPRFVWETMNALRRVDDQVFLKRFRQRWESYELSGRGVVITDGRMKCELDYVLSENYQIIFIEAKSVYNSLSPVETDLEIWKEHAHHVFVNDFSGDASFREFLKSKGFDYGQIF